ncbi:hypothetical protein B566_EDAN008561 [Ephemera danica]|nr:hypothetical protein B566_EDAN008561 [Ephemera danica]
MWVDGELEWLVRPAPVVAAVAAILNLIWRRQVLRFLAFLAGYLALISRYGNSCVVHPVVQTLKLAVLKLYSENADSDAVINSSSSPIKILSAPKSSEHADEVHCQVLHEPAENEHCVDVIFIHGLHGSLRNTWRQGMWSRSRSPDKRVLRSTRSKENGRCLDTSNGSHTEEPYASCWPKDWIPRDIPGARVLALNYTTDPYLWRPVWVQEQSR